MFPSDFNMFIEKSRFLKINFAAGTMEPQLIGILLLSVNFVRKVIQTKIFTKTESLQTHISKLSNEDKHICSCILS